MYLHSLQYPSFQTSNQDAKSQILNTNLQLPKIPRKKASKTKHYLFFDLLNHDTRFEIYMLVAFPFSFALQTKNPTLELILDSDQNSVLETGYYSPVRIPLFSLTNTCRRLRNEIACKIFKMDTVAHVKINMRFDTCKKGPDGLDEKWGGEHNNLRLAREVMFMF